MEVVKDLDSVQFYFSILFTFYIFTKIYLRLTEIIVTKDIHVVDLSTLQCQANDLLLYQHWYGTVQALCVLKLLVCSFSDISSDDEGVLLRPVFQSTPVPKPTQQKSKHGNNLHLY